MVLLYLITIVAANLSIAALGPAYAPLVGLVAIGFDITCRDRLHERWAGHDLFARMFMLLIVGGLLTWVFSPSALRIALASVAAFLCAGSADALVYHGLWKRGHDRWVRINGSNVVSSLLDSGVFLGVAFGRVPVWIFVAQVAAKVVGGFLWSLILFRRKRL